MGLVEADKYAHHLTGYLFILCTHYILNFHYSSFFIVSSVNLIDCNEQERVSEDDVLSLVCSFLVSMCIM